MDPMLFNWQTYTAKGRCLTHKYKRHEAQKRFAPVNTGYK